MNLDPNFSSWLEALSASFDAGELIKVSLAKPGANAADLTAIDIRPITVKREIKLSFTYHYKTRDIVKNYGLPEAKAVLSQQLTGIFSAAHLYSKTADISLKRREDQFVITRAKPSLRQVDLSHNRAKNHLVTGQGKPYLNALNLTDAEGHVLKTAQDKFRQINKYIEILDGLIKDLPLKKLRIVDMGAGKGYLTFALYDHLVTNLKRDCEIIGVEYRADLVRLCNEIAGAAAFSNLNFVEGTIAGYDCSGADIVIALHACDTATDDAIAKAIKAKAQLIVVAPCCHKQIRREMKTAHQTGNLDFLLRFGTYQERLAEMITDSLRAQLMELSGYECNLFEFISDAHTPKNVMIVAKRLDLQRTDAMQMKLADGIAKAKRMFGIETHYLEQALNYEARV